MFVQCNYIVPRRGNTFHFLDIYSQQVMSAKVPAVEPAQPCVCESRENKRRKSVRETWRRLLGFQIRQPESCREELIGGSVTQRRVRDVKDSHG